MMMISNCQYLSCDKDAVATTYVAGRWLNACRTHTDDYIARYGRDMVGPVNLMTELPGEHVLGFIDPWAAYRDLSPLEARYADGDR